MSAFCDIALALGLTFGGTCAADQPPQTHLPEDDPAAWELPAPPPPPEPAPPPKMPPIIIEKHVERAAPPPVVEQPDPEPETDPFKEALAAAWARPGALPTRWDALAVSEEAAAKAAGFRPKAPAPMKPSGPLDLAAVKPSDYSGPRRTSSRPVDNARIVTADRYITGILETGINSQVGGDESGTIVVQTARDVFGYHGRNVLIPKGSRLLCSFKPPADIGSSRLPLNCSRILMAGHRAEIRELDALVGNVQGQPGVSGEVDRRFWERYGTAFLLTGISTAVRFGSAATSNTDNEESGSSESASEKAAEELSQRFGEISASVLEQTLSLTPIITIPQGTRVQIRPAVDWYIAKAE
jgi:type IV secretion system protein VirB10